MKKVLYGLSGIIGLLLVGVAILFFSSLNPDSDATSLRDLKIQGNKVFLHDSITPFTGRVVLHDTAVLGLFSHMVPMQYIARFSKISLTQQDVYGLVVKVDVEEGTPSGKAEVFIDLDIAEANRNLNDFYNKSALLGVARALSPRVKVGEATIKEGKLEGPVKLFYPNPSNPFSARLIVEGQVKNNQPDGLCALYHKNGNKRAEAFFKEGKPTGLITEWYDSGNKKRELSTNEDGTGGSETKWYENGQKAFEQTVANGRRTNRTEWYNTGQLKTSTENNLTTWWYPDGSPQRERNNDTGIETSYYSDGSIRSKIGPGVNESNPRNGTLKEFHPNGAVFSEVTYVDDTPNGAYKLWYNNGQLWEEGTYDMGTNTGKFKKWWRNGELAEEHERENGQIEGLQRKWYDNGITWEKVEFRNGKKVGAHIKNWNNGNNALDCSYNDNGQLVGEYKRWYANGVLWEDAIYVDGTRNGAYKKWYNNDQIAYQYTYENGKIAGEYLKWYPNGTLRIKTTYVDGKIHGKFENWKENGELYEEATYAMGKKTQSSLKK